MKMNVATYNIWHAQNYKLKKEKDEKEINPNNIADVLYRNDVAICGLEEVDWNCKRTGYINEPYLIAEELTARTGIKHYWDFAAGLDGYHNSHSQYGNAIVSRYPIKNVRRVPVDLGVGVHDGYEPRALLIADLEVEGKMLTVIVTHFGLRREEQVLLMDTVTDIIKNNEYPILFMGDFNITYKSEEIYPRIAELLVDTSEDPALPQTFPSPGANRKIDFIFKSASIKTENPRVEQVMHSDHLPLFVTMDW